MQVIKIILSHPLPEFPELVDMPAGYRVLIEFPTVTKKILKNNRTQIIKRRQIKKRVGDKNEVIDIALHESTDHPTEILADIYEENIIPIDDMSKMIPVIEIPEEIEVVEIGLKDSRKPKIIKRRKLLKKIGPKIEETSIVSTYEDDKNPEHIVTVKEYNIHEAPIPIEQIKHKLEIIEVKPQKLEIVGKEDFPKLISLKLKKPKGKKAIKESKFPKFRLKSRIQHFPFPSPSESLQHAVISQLLPITKDHGELSRNLVEAENILKKKKTRRPKDIPYEAPELETVEHIDMPEKAKDQEEKLEVKHKRKQKKGIQSEGESTYIKLGKGEIPDNVEQPEIIKLKKIPKKTIEETEGVVKSLKLAKTQEAIEMELTVEDKEKPIRFKPHDIADIDIDLEILEKTEIESDEESKKPKTKKLKRKPKTKYDSMPDEKSLILGKGKEKSEDEEDDLSLHAKQKPASKDAPDEMKLKPIKKPKKQEPTYKITLEGPQYQSAATAYEFPEIIDEIIRSSPGGKKKIIRKVKRIKQKIGPVVETTTIETLIPKDEVDSPATVNVTIDFLETDKFDLPSEAIPMIELPIEEKIIQVTEQGKTITKKVIRKKFKKPKTDHHEITEIITVQEDSLKPKSIILTYIEDIQPEENIEKIFDLSDDRPKKDKPIIVELPETMEIEDRGIKKIVKTKRTFKRLHKPKEDIITLETEDVDGTPSTTVIIEKNVIPSDISDVLQAQVLEDYPTDTEITEDFEDSKPISKKITKRRIKKPIEGRATEITEFVTTEKEGELPKTEVNIYTTSIEEHPRKIPEIIVTELPEEILIKEIDTDNGPAKIISKKRVIKKLKSPKQDVFTLETTYEENKIPETIFTVNQSKDISDLPQSVQVIEIPEEITESNKAKKSKRVFHKINKDKLETTSIVTIEEDNKKPVTTVTISTHNISEIPPDDIAKLFKALTPKKLKKQPITSQYELETTDVHTLEHTQELGEIPEIPQEKVKIVREVKESVTIETVTSQKPIEEVPLIEELPEETEVVESVGVDGKKKKKIIKKRTIRKHLGDTREDTYIVRIEEEGKIPQTSVTVEEIEAPGELDQLKVEEVPTIEELPEEVIETEFDTPEGTKKTVYKKRVIKKRKGSHVEATEIFTVFEEGKELESSVTIKDITDDLEAPKYQEPQDQSIIIEELPEEVNVQEVTGRWGSKKKTIKKRVIKKQTGDKQEETFIVTVEEEGRKPQTTVTVTEKVIPIEEKIVALPEEGTLIEEVPEQVIVTTVETSEGPKKKTIKKKVYRKKKGDKQEETEILIVEEEGKAPEVSVLTREVEAEKPAKKRKSKETKEAVPELTSEGYLFVPSLELEKVETIPEEVEEMIQMELLKKALSKQIPSLSVPEESEEDDELIQDEKKVKKSVKKIIKRKKQKVEELDIDEPLLAEELPEEIEIIESVNEEGVPERKIVKKRVVKKRKGDKEEVTTIRVIEEKGKLPQTEIIIEEEELPLEEIDTDRVVIVEEIPELTEIVKSALVSPLMKTTKKKIIKKRRGSKQETTELILTESEGFPTETSITIEEVDFPEEQVLKLPDFNTQLPIIVQELPEQTQIYEDKTHKKVVKEKVKKTRTGTKQTTKKTFTVEEEGKKPVTTTIIEQIDYPEELLDQLLIPSVKDEKPVFVEDLNEVEIIDISVKEGPRKKTIKKSVVKKDHPEDTIKEEKVQPIIAEELPKEIHIIHDEDKIVTKRMVRSRKGSKHEITNIFTVEEEGKEPLSSVLIEEIEYPDDLAQELPDIQPEHSVIIQEMPEDQVTKTKKKIIKKRKGSKQENTEITVTEEEGKKPMSTVTIEELDVPEDIVMEYLPELSEEQDIIIVEELPDEVEDVDKHKTIKKKITKKRKGSKQETTEYVTLFETGKKPQTSVIIEEVDIPDDVLDELVLPTAKIKTPVFVEDVEDKVDITETDIKETPKRKIIKKKVVRKTHDIPEELTEEVFTADEETKESQSVLIEEMPEEIQIIEDEYGPKKITKKRTIKKQKGAKQEITHIVIAEEVGQKPQTTVEIELTDLPVKEKLEDIPVVIEELPEEIKEEEISSRWGPKKKTTKKRTIRKTQGDKEEDTYIVTVLEEGKQPQTSVVTEIRTLPYEKLEIPKYKPSEEITELPEDVQIIETITPEGKRKQKISKRIIKKQKPGREEKTEIITVEEEGKPLETSVISTAIEVPEEYVREAESPKYSEAHELPEQIEEQEIIDDQGVRRKRITKKRIIKKPKDEKEEVTTIMVIEEEGKTPQTTVVTEVAPVIQEKSPKKKVVKKPLTEKPKQLRREMSVLLPLEIKEVKFQKVKVVDAKDVPLFGEVKLRKPKKPVNKKITETKAQIPRLKSRIQHITFPPLTEIEQLPRISILEPVYRDNGVLSRNVQEAEKLPKTKKRRLKDKDIHIKKLEELDLEIDELKKKELEKLDDEFKYERKPREKPKILEEQKPLTIGKGKIESLEAAEEKVQLKKVPQKPEQGEEEPELKPSKKPSTPKKKGKDVKETETDKIQFEPFDIEHETPELEKFEPGKREEEVPAEEVDEKKKIPKKKKVLPAQEFEESIIVPGKPKPTENIEEPDISFKKQQKPKLPTDQDEIKLKPHKKEAKDEEYKVEIDSVMKHDTIVTFEGPDIEGEIKPDDTIEKTKVKKIKKIKKKTEKLVAEEEGVTTHEATAEELPSDELIESLEIQQEEPELVAEQEKSPEDISETEENIVIDNVVKKKKIIKKKGKISEITEGQPIEDETPKIEEVFDTTDITVSIKKIKKKEPKTEPLQIGGIPEQPTELEEIKLEITPEAPKKTKKVIPKHEVKKEKIPRLKSRITHIPFPPENESEHIPKISDLSPVYKENGILSRNIEEAEKVPKKKKIRIKDYERDLKDLEKLDIDMDDLKKKELESVDKDLYVKAKKIKPEKSQENKKIKIGKGKLPEQPAEEEEVHLKKIPAKVPEELPEEVEKVKPEEKKKKVTKPIPEDEETERLPFKPFDTERESVEKEELVIPQPEDDKVVSKDKKVIKKPKTKKEKEGPESIGHEIMPGIPKLQEEAETPEIKLKKKQKPKPEGETDDVILKPHKKEKEIETFKVEIDSVLKHDTIVTFEGPDIEIEITPEEDADKIKHKKKVIKKIKKTKEVSEEEIKPEESAIENIPEETVYEIEEPDVSEAMISEIKEDKPKKKVTKTKKPDVKREEIEFPKHMKFLIKRVMSERPQIPIITEFIPEFAEIKLRKVKPKERHSIEEVTIPKIRLKSKLERLDFPPFGEKEQKPIITDLIPVYCENGILSRSVDEAEKVKPKKKLVTRIKELEKIDKEFEELKKPLEAVDDEFKKRKAKPKKEKLIPIKIVTVEHKPQKPKIIDLTPEAVNFAEIKLKKSKQISTNEPTHLLVPKLKLKSRINWIDFPPMSEVLQPLNISHIGAVKDNGIISRNVEEAEKLKKTKRRKLKDVDKKVSSLEKLDLEFEELKKKEPEKVDEAYKYERRPQEVPEQSEIESVQIKIGKGKMPPQEDEPEQVKLKKIPIKIEEQQTEEKVKLKKQPLKEETLIEKIPKKSFEKPELQPFDIPQDDIELEKYEPLDYPEEENEEKEKPKPKYKRKKKETPVPETDEIKLVKDVPKTNVPEEEDAVILKAPRKPLPEEVPEELKLKPHKKEDTEQIFKVNIDTVMKHDTIITFEGPDDEMLLSPDIEEDKEKPKKKKKIVKKITRKGSTDIVDQTDLNFEEALIVEIPTESREEKRTEYLPDTEDVKLDKPSEEIETLKIKHKKKKIVQPVGVEDSEQPIVEDKEEIEEITEAVTKKSKNKTKPKSEELMDEELNQPEVPQTVLEVTTEKLEEIEEKPLEVKIKKPRKQLPKPEEKKDKVPRLKSRITHVPFPPENEIKKLPEITELEPVIRDNGIISRNVEEAEKIKKPKRKKPKDIPKEITELEKLDIEYEEQKKEPLEKLDDVFKFERKPKDLIVQPEEIPEIKIGKGKLPKPSDDVDEIKLKKVPKKKEEPEEFTIQYEKPKEPLEAKVIIIKDTKDDEFLPFEGGELEEKIESEEITIKKKGKRKIKPETPSEEVEESPVDMELPTAEIKKKVPKQLPKEKPEGLGFKLKSRVIHINFPPSNEAIQTPLISSIAPVIKDNAVISRNVEEASIIKPKKKKKVVEKVDSLDKLDLELEELKKGREKVDDEFRKRTKKPKKEKLIPMPIVTVEVRPQKAKVIDITPVVVNLAEIKLKKAPKKPDSTEPTELKLPKLKLKSRINWVDFPPLNEILRPLEITTIGAVKDNGVISRNIEEAEKIKKKRPKKFKDVDKELIELEKLDLEIDDIKKRKPEEVDEAYKYVKTPKEKPKEEQQQPEPLKISKSKKVPKPEEEEETVTLKKRPVQKEEVVAEDTVKIKPIPKEVADSSGKEPKGGIEGPPFAPFVYEHEDTERDTFSPIRSESPEEDKPTKKKLKKKPEKKAKPLPESEEIILEKGLPKPKEVTEEEEIKMTAPRKPKPEEELEELKLRPVKKPEEEVEGIVIEISQPPKYEDSKTILPRPDDEIDFAPTIDDQQEKKKKKSKPKEKSHEAKPLDELKTQDIPTEKEPEDVTQVIVAPKSKPVLEEEDEQIIIKKPKPKVSEPTEVEAATIIVKKSKPSEEEAEVEAQITIQPKVEIEEVIEEKVVIKKKKGRKPKPDEAAAEISIQKEIPIEVEKVDVVIQEEVAEELPDIVEKQGVTFEELPSEDVLEQPDDSIVPSQLPIIEEPKDVEVRKSGPVIEEQIEEVQEPEEIPDTVESIIVKKKPKKKAPKEEVEAAITIPKPQATAGTDVENEITIQEKEQTVISETPLDTSAQFTLIQEIPEQTPDEKTEEVVVKKKKSKIPVEVEEGSEVPVKIKRPKKDDKPEEEELKLSLKPEKHTEIPPEEAEILIKVPQIVSAEEEKPAEAVTVSIKPKKPISKIQEEEADEVTFKKVSKQPDDDFSITPPDEATLKIKTRKPKVTEETAEAEIVLTKVIPDETEVQDEDETVEVSIKPKPKEETVTEEIAISKKPEKIPEDAEDEISVKKFIAAPDEEDTEVKLKPKLEEEVETTFKKPKKKPKKTEDGEDAVKVKKYITIPDEEDTDVILKPKSEEEVETTFKKPTKKPEKTEDGADEITIQKLVPIKHPEEENEEEAEIKMPKPSGEEADETIKKKRPKTTEDAEDEVSIKKYVPVETDETEEETDTIFVKKPPKKEEEIEEPEAEIILPKKPPTTEEEVEIKIKKKKASSKPPTSDEAADELTVKKLKPVRKPSVPEEEEIIKEDDIPSVTFKPRVSKTKEDVEQEFRISLDSYAEEEISLSSKIKLKKPKRQLTFGEEAAEESVKIIEEYDSEGPAVEEIIDEGSEAEELPLDDEEMSESFRIAFRRKPSRKYSVVHEDEEDISLSLKKPHKQEDYEATEIDIKIKPKRRDSVSLSEDVSLSITKEKEIEKITVIHEEEVQKGDVYYAVSFYDAEADQACDLVEGEKVYVVDTQGEWWLVKKHLTGESGWVPATILMDEPQYIQFVQKKLNEKIDKLPVLEKPKSQEKPRAPRFLEKLQPITTHDGFSIIFQCKVEGYPRPQITWFRQTHIIKESVDFQMSYTEDNCCLLIINEVFPEDAGTFTCVAKNSAGFASSTAELTVEGPLSSHGSDRTHSISRKSLSRTSSLADILEGMPPVFAKKPNTQCVSEESDLTIDAILAAIPEPDIKWYRNGKKISTKENVIITTTSETYTYSTVMKITKITKKQEGRYKIVAKNSEGHATAEFTLRVRSHKEEPPEVVEPLISTTIRKGETVTLRTTIVGNPEPAIQWFRNEKPLETPPPKRNGDTYTVIIKNAVPDDTAEFTVKARNRLGSAETSAFLTVQEFPNNAEPPLFVKRFEEQNIPEKTPLILRAKVSGNPEPEVSWLFNNQPLTSSDRIRILFDGENIELTIKETNSELDSGTYKCIATNTMGRVSHGAAVNVEVDTVKFTKKLEKSYKTFERETLELYCETSHSVKTKWWYNDTEISGMDHRIVLHDGRTHKLIIKNISTKDAGAYKCTVKNQKTETTVEVEQRKLEFVKKLQDLEITEKDNAILEVEITSDTAEVIWLKDGQRITDIEEKFETEKEKGVRRLLIRSTSIHDEGEYSCKLLEDECKADVTIIELPPEIITPLQDKTVIKGEKAVFEIELSKGDALTKWYKDGKEIQFSEHIQLSIDGKTQKLKIYKSSKEDEGTYTCKLGKQTSSGALTVNVPSCEWIKPLPEETLVSLDGDAEFEVEISKEDVEVTWWKKDTIIESSSRYSITKDRTFRKLVVQKVTMEDQFEYSCTVEKFNLKTSSKLIVGGKPSPPRGPLEISGMTAQSFTIQWQPPQYDGNSPILEYIIEMKESKSKKGFKKVGATKGNVCDYAVNELKKDCGYKFKIYARNAIGLSDPYCPDEDFVAGSRITPPSPPINLKIKDLTSRSVTLSWEPPLNDGGSEITGYVLERKLEFMPSWEKVATLEAFSLEHTFENLKEKSDYVFRVYAENAVGLSAPVQTDVVQVRTLATVPTPPTPPLEIRTIGPNAIVVEWGIPEWDGGAPLLGYNIAIKDIKKTMWMEIGKTSKGLQKFTIRDLQEDHEYLIRIFARNEIGLSGPLESDEPFKVLPSGDADQDDFREATSEREPTSRSSETTTSWLRENSMDADIKSYAKGKLLRKDEYFFRIWCYATKLFK